MLGENEHLDYSDFAISTPERHVNRERGFDAAGKRVWGPEAGR
jgi:hypothetical protein